MTINKQTNLEWSENYTVYKETIRRMNNEQFQEEIAVFNELIVRQYIPFYERYHRIAILTEEAEKRWAKTTILPHVTAYKVSDSVEEILSQY